jgi:hypothetical protein
MININALNLSLLAAAPAGRPAANQCGKDERDHFQQLEENWEKREEVRQKAFTDSVGMIDRELNLVNGQPAGVVESAKGALFNRARRINFQTENKLLLEAARKSTDMYFRSKDEKAGKVYLAKAEKYLTTALANADNNLSFDLYRSPREFFSPTIHPVEAYFELQLARFLALSLTDPGAALTYSQEIRNGLESRRILQAQRSDDAHAAGYLNRLRILYGFAGLYNPAMDLNKAIASVRQGYDWAQTTHDRNLVMVISDSMNKKDLRYDSLLARVIEGRLLVKAGRYGDALNIFQALLKEPEAAKKYGGFLDIGQQAFFGIMHISLLTAGTLNQAAANFERNIDWQTLAGDNMADLRESLGLVIRDQSWKDKLKSGLEQAVKREVSSPSDFLGEYSLYLDRPWLALKEDSPIKHELKLADCKTPRDKLDLFIKLLDYIEFPFDQKASLISQYNMLGGGKK